MKKYLMLLILLAGLTACINENTNYANPNNDDTVLLGLSIAPMTVENNGLQAVQIDGGGEFGVGFRLRNESGHRLYYTDDFRVDSVPMTNAYNRFGPYFINHGDTQEIFFNWDDPLSTGTYTF